MARTNQYEAIIKPNLENIQHWVEEGYSNSQIFQILNVSETTFYKWLSIKSEFKAAIDRSKHGLQVRLEKALYKEACGYEYEEITTEIVEEDAPGGGVVRKKRQRKTKKYARPNSTLLIFALCNRFNEKWKRVDKDTMDELVNTLEKTFDNSKLSESILKTIEGKIQNQDQIQDQDQKQLTD